MKTLSEIAGEHAKLFITKQFERDGEKFTRVVINRVPDYPAEETELHKSCVELTFQVSQGTGLDSDSVYEFTSRVLDQIADIDTDSEDDAQEAINELEPDMYTNELTAWLARSCNNVSYLDDAVENGARGGFSILSQAQYAAIREVGGIVLSFICDLRNNQDCGDCADCGELLTGNCPK